MQLHCVERDLFCWISGGPGGSERLLGLPVEWEQAQRELATTLERDHGFSAPNASAVVGTLFDRAFEEPQPKPEPAPDGRIPVTGYVLPRSTPGIGAG